MNNQFIFEMADQLRALKAHKKDLEEEVKVVGKEIEELDAQLSDAMMEEEVEKFSRNGSTFYLKSRLYASSVAGQKGAVIQALKDNGYAELVTESVNANTLSSFIKEQRELTGEDVPEWLKGKVNTFEKISIGIRKS